MNRLTFLFFIILLINSCAGNKENSSTESNPAQDELATEKETQVSDIPIAVLEHGEDIYKKHCLACHQTNGSGNPGMYPPLDNTEMVNGEKEELIKVILNGLTGEIEVKGEIYNQVMVPHNFLSDHEIADLLTYVRNSFGNSSSRIKKEEVAAVRNSQ